MPVGSYAPELLALYQKAFQEHVTVKLKTMTEGHKLRSRLHSLRRAMRDEDHPMTNIANGVIVSLKRVNDGALLTAYPADKQFLSYLEAAGVVIEEHDSTTELEGGLEETNDPADDQMETFFRGKNKE